MALGKKLFQIDYRDFVQGMSTSNDLADAGFGSQTDCVNLTAVPGVAYAPALPVDKSTNIAGSIIASSDDGQFLTSTDRVFLDDGGNFYTWNGTTMTLARADVSHNYVQGKTDMVGFGGSVFATSDTTLVKWTVDSGFDAAYVSGFTATVPHPLLVYENNMFMGEKNILKRFTDASDTTPDDILTLDSNQVIVALGIDPGSGKMLISVTSSLNLSGTLNNSDRVLYYDGFSNKATKVVLVDEMITAFFPVGSYMYIGYGQSLGYWNGAGIQFLRRLNISFDNTRLLYKQHFTNIGTTLYCIENTQILAHGPINSNGNRVFYYALKNNTNSNVYTHIASIGQNKLGTAFATNKFFTWDASSVADSNQYEFWTNQYQFDTIYNIRRIKVYFKTSYANTSNAGTLQLIGEEGVLVPPGNTLLIQNLTGATTFTFDTLAQFSNQLCFTDSLQMRFIFNPTFNLGIKRIIVYGDVTDR